MNISTISIGKLVYSLEMCTNTEKVALSSQGMLFKMLRMHLVMQSMKRQFQRDNFHFLLLCSLLSLLLWLQ
jgi:hypothetical protein